MRFGDLRSAVEEARRDPARVDVVLWLLLSEPADAPHRAEMVHYTQDKLRGAACGEFTLRDVLLWSLDAARALDAEVRDRQRALVDREELPDLLLTTPIVHDWVCSFAWMVSTGAGDMRTDRHMSNWASVVDQSCHRWFGLGFNSGQHVAFFHGLETSQSLANTPYHRYSFNARGEQWPGIPARLGGRPLP